MGRSPGLCFWLIVFLIGLSGGGVVWAEYDRDDLSLWAPVTLELPLTDKIGTSLQLEGRWNNNVRDLSGIRIVPAIEYALNEHVLLNATYGWYPDFEDGAMENEHRFQQEIELRRQWPRISVALAQRIEERMIEDVDGLSLRTRTQLTLRVPIGDGPWYAVAVEDLRFNLNSPDNGPVAGFDQNRIFAGLGRTVGRTTVEGGYQLRYGNVPGTDVDEMEHIILVRLNYRLR